MQRVGLDTERPVANRIVTSHVNILTLTSPGIRAVYCVKRLPIPPLLRSDTQLNLLLLVR